MSQVINGDRRLPHVRRLLHVCRLLHVRRLPLAHRLGLKCSKLDQAVRKKPGFDGILLHLVRLLPKTRPSGPLSCRATEESRDICIEEFAIFCNNNFDV